MPSIIDKAIKILSEGASTGGVQLRVGFDAGSYFDVSVADTTGVVSFNATGSTPAFAFADAVTMAETLDVTGVATLAEVDIDAGEIDGTVIGANDPAEITGTTITATAFEGPIGGGTPAAGAFTTLASSGGASLATGGAASSYGGSLQVGGADAAYNFRSVGGGTGDRLRVYNYAAGGGVEIGSVNAAESATAPMNFSAASFSFGAANVSIGGGSPASNAIVRYLYLYDATSAGVVYDGNVTRFSTYVSSGGEWVLRDETAAVTRVRVGTAGQFWVGGTSAYADTLSVTKAGTHTGNAADLGVFYSSDATNTADAAIRISVYTQDWRVGIDNSDSDRLKIGQGSAWDSTGTAVSISPSDLSFAAHGIRSTFGVTTKWYMYDFGGAAYMSESPSGSGNGLFATSSGAGVMIAGTSVIGATAGAATAYGTFTATGQGSFGNGSAVVALNTQASDGNYQHTYMNDAGSTPWGVYLTGADDWVLYRVGVGGGLIAYADTTVQTVSNLGVGVDPHSGNGYLQVGTGTHTSGVGTAASFVQASSNQTLAYFRNENTTPGTSYGVLIDAGTNGTDNALMVRNAAATTTLLTLYGQGTLRLHNSGIDIPAGAVFTFDGGSGSTYIQETTGTLYLGTGGAAAIEIASSRIVTFKAGAVFESTITAANLPTSDPSVSGQFWVDGSGFVKASA